MHPKAHLINHCIPRKIKLPVIFPCNNNIFDCECVELILGSDHEHLDRVIANSFVHLIYANSLVNDHMDSDFIIC